MKANVYSMLEECQEGCSLVVPSAEAVVAGKRSGDTKLNVIIDCEHRPVCEMWKKRESEEEGAGE